MDISKRGDISKEDLKSWTKAILNKKFPGVPFDEEAFEKGYNRMDTNKDGIISREDVRIITINKLKRENLFFDN